MLDQFTLPIKYLLNSTDFIVKNKLWKGYFNHGIISYTSILLVVLLSFDIFGAIKSFGNDKSSETSPALTMDSSEVNPQIDDYIAKNVAGVELNSVAVNRHLDKGRVFSGGIKFLSLILLNMLVFHFCMKTMALYQHEEKSIGLKDYLHSQIRVLKLAIQLWILGILGNITISLFTSLFGYGYLENILNNIFQMTLFGFLFFDSYMEFSGYSLKEGRKELYPHIIPMTIIGSIAFLFFKIPVIGIVIGAILCSVAATRYMLDYNHHKLLV